MLYSTHCTFGFHVSYLTPFFKTKEHNVNDKQDVNQQRIFPAAITFIVLLWSEFHSAFDLLRHNLYGALARPDRVKPDRE